MTPLKFNAAFGKESRGLLPSPLKMSRRCPAKLTQKSSVSISSLADSASAPKTDDNNRMPPYDVIPLASVSSRYFGNTAAWR